MAWYVTWETFRIDLIITDFHSLFVYCLYRSRYNFLHKSQLFVALELCRGSTENLGNNWCKGDRNYKTARKEIQIRYFHDIFKTTNHGQRIKNIPALSPPQSVPALWFNLYW